MNKLLSALAFCGILLFGTTSCGDDGSTDPQFGPGQTPMQKFVLRLIEKETTLSSRFTFGSMLELQKAGRISQLCLMAKTDGTFSLSLWDLSDTTVITSSLVNADANALECVDITDVLVSAGDRVAVFMTGNSALFWDNNGSAIYPSSLGDVKILGFGSGESPIGVQFPNIFPNDRYMGLADIVFEPLIE